jgi:hypothetical protein
MEINLYVFLAIAELATVLACTTGYFWWRSNRSSKINKKSEDSDNKSYVQYLNEELSLVQETLDALDQDDEADLDKNRANKLRKEYLQLESDLQKFDSDTDEFIVALKEGCTKILGDLENNSDDSQMDADEQSGFTQLRAIIENQNASISELGKNLRHQNDKLDNYEDIQAILKTYESQNEELIQCVDVLEKNTAQNESSEQEKGSLITMVSDQQTTIENLRTLIVKLPADNNLAGMETALDKIQHNNRELNDCVTVLEGENERLRGQLDEVGSSLSEKIKSATDDLEAEQEENAEEKLEAVSE